MSDSCLTPGRVKQSLEFLRRQMGSINVVCGIGPIPAKLMIVGEAPGQHEDEQDMPFVGRSGDLLNMMLKQAGLNRDEIFITNTVKCRPTIGRKNRPPTDDEIKQSRFALWQELVEVQPIVVITLGMVPTRTLLTRLRKSDRLTRYAGNLIHVQYMKTVILPIWHPSFLLRSKKTYLDKSIVFLKKAKDFVVNTQNHP